MKMTHQGTHNCPLWGNPVNIKLRETKMYWITEQGVKYKKKNGYLCGQHIRTFSSPRLLLDTVKPI